MKILHLVLFAVNVPEFAAMKEISSEYYRRFEKRGVQTVYYRYCPTMESPYRYQRDRDELHVYGMESYVPGILKKTLLAMDYFNSSHPVPYDYVVRSNISSIINFDRLLENEDLRNGSALYGAGIVQDLQWLDPAAGITDSSLFGTVYASGTCIVMHKRIVRWILANLSQIRYDIVDDVAIGILLKQCPLFDSGFECRQLGIARAVDSHSRISTRDVQECLLVRHRTPVRSNDVVTMKRTVAALTAQQIRPA